MAQFWQTRFRIALNIETMLILRSGDVITLMGDVSRKILICIKKYPADLQKENIFESKKYSKGPEPSCCKVFVAF